MQHLGWLLREIRQRADMSQDEIARLAGASRSQVSRWENGQHEPSYRKIRRLADALHDLDPGLDDLSGRLVRAAGYDRSRLAGAPTSLGSSVPLTDEELDAIEAESGADLSSLGDKDRRILLTWVHAVRTRAAERDRDDRRQA